MRKAAMIILRVLSGYSAAAAVVIVQLYALILVLDGGLFGTEGVPGLVYDLIIPAVLLLSAPAALLSVFLAEPLGIRHPFFYTFWAVAPAAFITFYIGAGPGLAAVLIVSAAVGGVVYWLVSGRHAGERGPI